MNIHNKIYDMVVNKTFPLVIDEKKVHSQIDSIIFDNGFDSLPNRFSDDVVNQVIVSTFYSVFSMKKEDIVLYFENYTTIKSFREKSNQLLNAAYNMYINHPDSKNEQTDAIKQFDDVVAEIFSIYGLSNLINGDLSDCMIDIAYLKRETDQISIRLSRRVRN